MFDHFQADLLDLFDTWEGFDGGMFGNKFSDMDSMKPLHKSKFDKNCLPLKLNLMKKLFFSVQHLLRCKCQGLYENGFDGVE